MNDYIRSAQVRVIDETGEQLGVKPITEAIMLARSKGLDLIEIVPNSMPPVCRIVDYSKYKYEEERKLRQLRKKTKTGQVKEIRLRPRIGGHDLEFKIAHAREFLEKKFKVKCTIMFIGREKAHRDIGYGILDTIKEKLSDIAVVEGQPRFEGNRLIALFTQKK
ncbi:MAG: translation initiation factor IF-3 [Elusimicrobia bacterium]|nr:translation initiation factor IF-3 [Elusimicrobiota bacterium]